MEYNFASFLPVRFSRAYSDKGCHMRLGLLHLGDCINRSLPAMDIGGSVPLRRNGLISRQNHVCVNLVRGIRHCI